jgi:hypothetical protein
MRELDSGNSEDAEAESKVAAQLSCESIAPGPELDWAYTRSQVPLTRTLKLGSPAKSSFVLVYQFAVSIPLSHFELLRVAMFLVVKLFAGTKGKLQRQPGE